jgi:hypothetical protein
MQPDPPRPDPQPPAGEGHRETRANRAPGRLWTCALAAALVGGIGSWLAGEAVYGRFQVQVVKPPNWNQLNTFERQDYLVRQEVSKEPTVATKNSALTYGILGGVLGAAMGLAGGLAGGSWYRGLWNAVIGLAAGVAAGAGGAALAVPMFFRYLDPESSLMLPLLTHAAIFGLVGAVGGAVFGLGLGRGLSVLRATVGGLAGGLVGTVVFEVLIAIAYPLMKREAPIPLETIPRLAVHLGVAMFTALFVVLSLVSGRSAKAPPTGEV